MFSNPFGTDAVADLTGLFDALSLKIGAVLLVIGVDHLCNRWGFSSARRRHRLDELGVMKPIVYPTAPAAPQR